ncbi:hypothetical protein D5018_13320 [Parashewanella curva]|uniref:Uncharacterized protein n=1 Tax=Parashewanella curva TaxID=2338552 RepID=A0A3L8PYN7_9GAMM|nr:hypothetical protein [Parashewanella curva]RLV59192.1 hypothetical protein D5018_13320 [Parashewanella curva]
MAAITKDVLYPQQVGYGSTGGVDSAPQPQSLPNGDRKYQCTPNPLSRIKESDAESDTGEDSELIQHETKRLRRVLGKFMGVDPDTLKRDKDMCCPCWLLFSCLETKACDYFCLFCCWQQAKGREEK